MGKMSENRMFITMAMSVTMKITMIVKKFDKDKALSNDPNNDDLNRLQNSPY